MRGTDGLAEVKWREAQRFAALRGSATANALGSRRLLRADTSARRTPGASESAQTAGESGHKREIDGLRSRPATRSGRRSRLIREKIIGHGLPFVPAVFAGATGVPAVRWTLALLHEPARQQGRTVFLHPLIQQNGNLLSKIGGVREPRELVGLQGIARSRQQEFPRRLGLVVGHKGLPSEEPDSNTLVQTFQGLLQSYGLWKNVENSCGLRTAAGEASRAGVATGEEARIAASSEAMQACSACAGDYEDPDRTAGGEDDLPDEDGERELDEHEADTTGPDESEKRATRRQIDAVPEGFMNGE